MKKAITIILIFFYSILIKAIDYNISFSIDTMYYSYGNGECFVNTTNLRICNNEKENIIFWIVEDSVTSSLSSNIHNYFVRHRYANSFSLQELMYEDYFTNDTLKNILTKTFLVRLKCQDTFEIEFNDVIPYSNVIWFIKKRLVFVAEKDIEKMFHNYYEIFLYEYNHIKINYNKLINISN